MKRKHFILTACATALSILLATGCAPQTAPASSNADATSSISAHAAGASDPSAAQHSDAAQKPVKNLKIGTLADNKVFNASNQKDAFGRMNYNCLTQGNFVYRDEKNQLQPFFFRSFKISNDGKTLDFTVPEKAFWHDGQPVTVEDILFTFDFMRDVKKVGSLQNLTEVKQTGDYAYTLVFSEPDAYYWLNSSAFNTACVFAKHIWEQVPEPDAFTDAQAAIGCGPYKLVSHDDAAQSSYYEVVPENDYAGVPSVKSVTLQTYANEDALVMAMINGEIDAMFNYANPIDATLVETLQGTPDINLGESDYAGQYQLTYGMAREPGNDIAFRKAVRAALDYDQLATTINGRFGKHPGTGIIAPPNRGFDPSLPILEQDLKTANQLLDEAGYLDKDGDGYRDFPDGRPMNILVTPQFSKTSQDLLNRIADVIMDSLKKVNIRTTLDQDSLANSEKWEANISAGQYDLSIGYTTPGMAAYSSAFRYFLADAKPGEKTWIWGTFHDADFQQTLFDMQGATSDDVYISNIQKLQHMADQTVFAQALCWEVSHFPYRTDRYVGWENYPSWGVINGRTWYVLHEK